MNQEIAKELLSVYGALSREELKEKMITLYEFQNNINLVLFINFFEDIFKESNGKMLLICNGNEYQNLLEWKDSVIQCQVKFGVRYHCEDEVLDLFVRDLSSNKFVFASKNKELSGFGKNIKEEGYFSAQEPTSWFLNALLGIEDWEKRCKSKLSSHVVKDWFGIKK